MRRKANERSAGPRTSVQPTRELAFSRPPDLHSAAQRAYSAVCPAPSNPSRATSHRACARRSGTRRPFSSTARDRAAKRHSRGWWESRVDTGTSRLTTTPTSAPRRATRWACLHQPFFAGTKVDQRPQTILCQMPGHLSISFGRPLFGAPPGARIEQHEIMDIENS